MAPAPAGRPRRTNRKEGDHALRDPLYFSACAEIDIPGLGTATSLEAVGTTENMKGEKMLDKMSAHCAALSVASGLRVIGVVLTGGGSDGTAGLRKIKASGGVSVVQDPEEARAPQMPQNALIGDSLDFKVPLSEMAALLVRLQRGVAL